MYRIPPDLRVSVVVLVYNERATPLKIVRGIRAAPIAKEIILVDHGSSRSAAVVSATGKLAFVGSDESPYERLKLRGIVAASVMAAKFSDFNTGPSTTGKRSQPASLALQGCICIAGFQRKLLGPCRHV